MEEKKLTLQEAFDVAVAGLVGQGLSRSRLINKYGEDAGCGYRSQGGKKCALGHIIPDSEYKPEMEGFSAKGLHDACRMPARLSGIHIDVLDDLQRCHDCGYDPLVMRLKLIEFATKNKLTVPQCLLDFKVP